MIFKIKMSVEQLENKLKNSSKKLKNSMWIMHIV